MDAVLVSPGFLLRVTLVGAALSAGFKIQEERLRPLTQGFSQTFCVTLFYRRNAEPLMKIIQGFSRPGLLVKLHIESFSESHQLQAGLRQQDYRSDVKTQTQRRGCGSAGCVSSLQISFKPPEL